jgi:cytochrome b6
MRNEFDSWEAKINMRTTGSFWSLISHLHPLYVPQYAINPRYTWCMGGLAAWIFFVEVITGILLLFQYVPTKADAYNSIIDISQAVPFGFFIRNIHYWAGQLMVVFVTLHMIRVIITRSYSAPRQLNWLIGLILFILTLLVDFSGYLLIWDDRSLWAWTIARNLVITIPYIGYNIAEFLFGPSPPHDFTIIRLYIWHIFVFPTLMTSLLFWHFWKIRKDGFSHAL